MYFSLHHLGIVGICHVVTGGVGDGSRETDRTPTELLPETHGVALIRQMGGWKSLCFMFMFI